MTNRPSLISQACKNPSLLEVQIISAPPFGSAGDIERILDWHFGLDNACVTSPCNAEKMVRLPEERPIANDSCRIELVS